jgi:hypothetical protein
MHIVAAGDPERPKVVLEERIRDADRRSPHTATEGEWLRQTQHPLPSNSTVRRLIEIRQTVLERSPREARRFVVFYGMVHIIGYEDALYESLRRRGNTVALIVSNIPSIERDVLTCMGQRLADEDMASKSTPAIRIAPAPISTYRSRLLTRGQ